MENFLSNCIGIDISKEKLDLFASLDGSDHSLANNDAGIRQCLALCRKIKPQLIVLEATGNYEQLVYASLAAEGFPIAVINPGRIRDFAKATGQLAKTDKIDARIITLFAQTLQPPAQEAVDENTLFLKALVTRRRQLIELRTAEKNHDEHSFGKAVKKSVKEVIDFLDKQIELIDIQIAEHIDNTPELKQKADLLKTIPGIGEVTARALVVTLPELGQCNRKEIARLCGVAPINRDSGRKSGKRFTGNGRVDIRTHLFMPILVAIRYNPAMRKFYTRLVEVEHKPKMVAIVATMRKLVCIMNSMIQNNQPWNPALMA